jgi:cytochrome P450
MIASPAADDPFGLLTPDTRRSPYAAYARMRAAGDVVLAEAWGGYAVLRWGDVFGAFRDPRLSSDRSAAMTRAPSPEARARIAPLTRNLASWALLVDPPRHTRLRALITKAFTPRIVDELRPKIAELAGMLVDDALARGDVIDVLHDLAVPLPVVVIGDLLGLPRADRHRLKAWSDALATLLGAARPTPDQAAVATSAVVDMEDYFRAVVADRRRAPTDDLLGHLVRAQDGEAVLDDQELLSTCAMVLFGGHETTTNLIANGVASLLAHEGELRKLRASAELLPAAIDELMRFEPPVQRVSRVAREDVELGGTRLPAGSRVFLVMAAAQRDPAVFDEPDRLRLDRPNPKQLGFGFGAHHCVGAALARAEAELALSALLARPRLEPAYAELAWTGNATLRGLETLPVRV